MSEQPCQGPAEAPDPPTANKPADEEEELLFCLSINPTAETTLVFLHGVLSSRLEWAHVTPRLEKDYHLLVVDVNAHSNSSHLGPAGIPASADRVASLIRRRAHKGRAHVVGLSMGGFIALDLARRYPDLVISVFETGAHPYEGWFRWFAQRPTLVWYMQRALHALPDRLYWGLCDRYGMRRHEELRREMAANRRWQTVRDVYTGALDLGDEQLRQIAIPVLAVAAEKGDQVGATAKMGPLLREGGDERSKAVVVEKATHAWDLQFPELFARGVRAWVEGKELPADFRELKG